MQTSRIPRFVALGLMLSTLGLFARAEKAWGPPPRGSVQLTPKPELVDAAEPHSPKGEIALKIHPAKWKHAETEHFVLHYRRATEAQKVAREIEYNLWHVATALGAKKEQVSKKSHVYIFQDRKEWMEFIHRIDLPSWAASFAYGDDLFLHVGGPGEGFDSHLLSHETTHAIVARIYQGKRWPLWLNEGFAEYMGAASIAARRGQYLGSLQNKLSYASLPFDELFALQEYPKDTKKVVQLYQTSERIVRFLMTRFPKDRFPQFVEASLEGKEFKVAVAEVYGDLILDFEDFKKQYAKFRN